MKSILIISILFLSMLPVWGQKKYELRSPDGKLLIAVEVDRRIRYTLFHEADKLIDSSPVSMLLKGAKDFGVDSKLINARMVTINQTIASPLYKRTEILDHCNELTLRFRENFSLVFRAYNEGMAYRFVSTGKSAFFVLNEEATFNFENDKQAYIPYVKGNFKTFEDQFFNSFENTYSHTLLSKMNPMRIAFTPLVVEASEGKKICLAESDLESYPGMFLGNTDGSNSLKSFFAPCPASTKQGGQNQIQRLVTQREAYIAKCKGARNFPWRIAIVACRDSELADSDMVYKLASPARFSDLSWIKSGKVAWEWWNNWGLSQVDFEVGINNRTYMAYIDFAATNGIEYVILDDGWSETTKADLFNVVPGIDLKKLVEYGRSKNVGLILWAGYHPFHRDMERVCRHYSELGIKGFKIDFMDRDDQDMVDFHYQAAETAARYKLLLDFHGTYKPTGLNRTYPNVVNYEGVHGLEQMKWSDIRTDQVTYDVTFPFIRMVAGPVDYTQGAMRNATKRTFRPIMDEPMSQGTRCRQLAGYVVFESPLNMLCDSPDNYRDQQECTDFIAAIPTVWEQTIALNGEIGQYITLVRRKGKVWYLGAMTNWDARTVEVDLSFLGEGNWKAELFKDGINANKMATDYVKETIEIPRNRKFTLSMAQGGGCAMKIFQQ